MDRDIARRVALGVFLVSFGASVSASSLPKHSAAPDSHAFATPSGWTAQLGAVDRSVDPSRSGSVSAPAVWDGAVATYNLVSSSRTREDASVFVADGSLRNVSASGPSGFAETIRAMALPAPMAWWLVLAGLVGVVGISRRRAI